MEYKKPPLSFEKQAELLLQRGLIAEKPALVARLQAVNYYRLSAYLYPFKNSDESFKPDTTLEKVWNHYTFDRQLRFLLMDAVERIEISLKTRLTEYFTCKYNDPFAHLKQHNFSSCCDIVEIGNLIQQVRQTAKKSREDFVKHFEDKYKEHKDLPLWMAVEIMTFGNLLTLYRCLDKHNQAYFSKVYGVPSKVFDSWVICFNYIRNLCAHHSRVWNRKLAIRPLIPRKDSQWQTPVMVFQSQNKMFSVLTIIRYLLKIIAPQSGWADRFNNLLNKYPSVPLKWMGFPNNWKECPIWKGQV